MLGSARAAWLGEAARLAEAQTQLLDYLLGAAMWAALWPLSETSGTTMADATGNGRDGTYSGTFTLDQGSLAPNGQGNSVKFFFDGGVDPKGIGQVPAHASLDLTTEGTLFALVQGDVDGSNPIICKDECLMPHGYGFHWNNATPLGYTRDTGAGTQVISGPTVAAGQHLTAFRWRADRSSIWVDDAEVASGGGMISEATADDLAVGANLQDPCGSSANHRVAFAAAVGLYLPDSVLVGAWAAIQ